MRRDQHFRFGRHSGIPRCCCAWFCVVRVHRSARWVNFLNRIERLIDDVDYVACPLCRIRRRFVRLHMCDDRCGWFT